MKAKESGRHNRGNAGFTLVEVIVIVAVIAIVAGVVAPMLFKQIDEAKVTRAEADCKSISSAVQAFRKDLGVWPNLTGTSGNCTPGIGLLFGSGNMPVNLAAMGFEGGDSLDFADVFGRDDLGCYNSLKYKGPYLPSVGADPWGNAYIVGAINFEADNAPVFVYSAGPNGSVDSNINDLGASVDDIAIRVK